MIITFKILGWIFVFVSFVMAYAFYNQYQINPADLKLSQGVIASAPKLSKDEYGHHNTLLKFYLENEEIPVSVPGILLNQADQKILELKAGDAVRFYEKTEEAKNFLEKKHRYAMGLGTEDGYFYTLEDALAFSQSPQKLFYAIFSVVMGIVIAYFLLK